MDLNVDKYAYGTSTHWYGINGGDHIFFMNKCSTNSITDAYGYGTGTYGYGTIGGPNLNNGNRLSINQLFWNGTIIVSKVTTIEYKVFFSTKGYVTVTLSIRTVSTN